MRKPRHEKLWRLPVKTQILSGLSPYFSTLLLCEEVKAHSERAISRSKNVFTENQLKSRRRRLTYQLQHIEDKGEVVKNSSPLKVSRPKKWWKRKTKQSHEGNKIWQKKKTKNNFLNYFCPYMWITWELKRDLNEMWQTKVFVYHSSITLWQHSYTLLEIYFGQERRLYFLVLSSSVRSVIWDGRGWIFSKPACLSSTPYCNRPCCQEMGQTTSVCLECLGRCLAVGRKAPQTEPLLQLMFWYYLKLSRREEPKRVISVKWECW